MIFRDFLPEAKFTFLADEAVDISIFDYTFLAKISDDEKKKVISNASEITTKNRFVTHCSIDLSNYSGGFLALFCIDKNTDRACLSLKKEDYKKLEINLSLYEKYKNIYEKQAKEINGIFIIGIKSAYYANRKE